MKALIFLLAFAPLFAFAQKVDLKDVDTDGESTTIEISKNKNKANRNSNEPIWEVADGTNSIQGEEHLMLKEAKQNWVKACDKWKKEFRADNKENKIIDLNCGEQSCTSDAAGKVCSSTAKYKIKTKLN